ncbi:hypothetical protein Leryth_019410 [Lithospermum erythrorhizon]|nr:hypothetical protein Leryth_019410 [Lithospermum erythrorhizon]
MVTKTNTISLISFIFFIVFLLLPTGSLSKRQRLLLSNDAEQYAVIFDAGSTGSRVHVFRFNDALDLLQIGDDLEFYQSVKPGLSSYANDPEGAALSILPLLKDAEQNVPESFRPSTPVRLGATAGLRLLEGDASERILERVRDLFHNETTLLSNPDWVAVLDGYHEGAYLWIALNYLLNNLGNNYTETVATIDLGGGSVQMSYAITKESASNAPNTSNEEEPYVQSMHLIGADYSIYAHSYLNYGRNAARAGNLDITNTTTNPCISTGYDGYYEYNGINYKATSPARGANFYKCSKLTKRILNIKTPCNFGSCTFNGAWSGGGGAGQKTIYVASYFYEMTAEAGVIPLDVPSGKVRPVDFKNAAKLACKTRVEDMTTVFPQITSGNEPFLCMDFMYAYTLLVDGFGKWQRLILHI